MYGLRNGIFVQHPGKGDLCVGCAFYGGILADHIQNRLVGLEVFFCELGHKFPHIVTFKFGVPGYFSGKKADGNGRERDNTNAMRYAVWENICFTAALHHGIDILNGRNRSDLIRTAQHFHGNLGKAPARMMSS